ncbi:hypothetical protein PR048_028206 [Dryococelus australis]|uniref:Uncharacterized protein n=1 Tax=Dryococelus australis TaxID=614101 RepID=A0ABQ9GII7_9NEOP|nr:hypothetical protein PR048_028206 [Dryococelus australis]
MTRHTWAELADMHLVYGDAVERHAACTQLCIPGGSYHATETLLPLTSAYGTQEQSPDRNTVLDAADDLCVRHSLKRRPLLPSKRHHQPAHESLHSE